MRTIYRFESELTPVEIMGRVRATARYAGKGWRLTSDTLFYEIMDDSHFMLIYTGFAGANGGQPPFIGELSVENGKTVITGQFQPDKKQAKLFGIFVLVPIALLLIIDFAMFLTALPFYLIWVLLGYYLLWNTTPKFWVKTNKQVIKYIKENLLK